MRKPEEFAAFPNIIHPGFGPYTAVTRWDARWDDGDTIWFWVDRGFNDYSFHAIRFRGIDAPEVRGVTRVQGIAARDFLFSILPYNSPATLVTEQDPEAYGRYVADIIALDKEGKKICVNTEMVRNNFATKKPEWGWERTLATCRLYQIDTGLEGA